MASLPLSPSSERRYAFKTATTWPSYLLTLFSIPTATELQACWELCRLHNNIGFWVVWLPTAWSISMAYYAKEDMPGLTALRSVLIYVPLCFGIKCLIMAIDDILDSDIDGSVERTRNRPLPRGAITVERAWLFFAIQVVIGFYTAHRFLDSLSLQIVKIVCPIYVIYPTCKRWMSFAPIPLGIMFNIGVFMGWSSLSEYGIPWNVLTPVYIGACCWTITYETVYQHQDKFDDVKIGIHSPALFLGHTTIPVCACSAVGFVGLLAYGGYLNNQGPAFFASAAAVGVLLLWGLWNTDLDKPNDCKKFFLATTTNGQIILAGMIVDAIQKRLTNHIPL